MPFDTSPVTPAPSRRSNRSTPAPHTAPVESTPTSAAEFVTAVALVAEVISAHTDAAPAGADVVPMTRRQARELARAAAAPVEAEVLVAEHMDTGEVFTTAEVVEAIVEPEVEPEPVDLAETGEFELLEPEFVPAEPVVEEEPTEAPVIDEFEAAARLFSFTGETPVQSAPEEPAPDAGAPASDTAHVASGRKRRVRVPGTSFKRAAAASFSVGVMGIVGLLTVGMTMPAEAVAAVSPTASLTSAVPAGDVYDASSGEIQAYVAPADVQSAALDRTETYSTGSLVELAGTEGISNYSSSVFTNDASCAIQWPFATGVTMSYGFGMRSGRLHEGIDFTPGEGAHIQAIADGVVRISTDSGGAYGATVVIDHIIDGQLVSTRYGHMQYGSRQVQVGDEVKVGEYIGRTGNTGRSFGAHTHVEVLMNGTTAIDPLPWLRSHATC